MTRLIKRYANRKLYDTQSSTYVTLDDVESMVRKGAELQIVDQKSGEDITGATLAHIVLEQQKINPSFPVSVLRGIIQYGEDFFSLIPWSMTQLRQGVRRRSEALEEGGRAVGEFVEGAQRSIEELQRRVDERVRDAVGQLAHIPEMRQELAHLRETIEALEKRLEQLEDGQGESAGSSDARGQENGVCKS